MPENWKFTQGIFYTFSEEDLKKNQYFIRIFSSFSNWIFTLSLFQITGKHFFCNVWVMTIIAYIFTLEMKIGLQEKAEIGSKFLIGNITVDWYINIVTVYFYLT